MSTQDATLRDTLADMILEATRDDLVEALGQEEFDRLAAEGRAIVERAILAGATTALRNSAAPGEGVP